ncbi:hypothetical protein [Ectothiorhodospira shaposhnikovii]|uniref:hypothetical protein n=1 Tax=Ectothiorhodospira shaposhnikovii TaxID=1054 RepID=UPI001EE8DADE|nr:hypothetical protein [Ectothiorhodospira shaposhnikovii]MCG5512773.1 hypothetical protein [Ectothiorhodospira shaposhnikovii]
MSKRLMLVSEYRHLRFTPGSRPSINTLKKWIREGELPGKRLGNLYYVEVEAEASAATEDELINRILRG